jgi:transposase
MKKEKLTLEEILRPIPDDRLHELSRVELIALLQGEQKIRQFFQKVAEEQQTRVKELEDEIVLIEGKYYRIKNKYFGRSSEKSTKTPGPQKDKGSKKERGKVTKKLSERYPNTPIIEKKIEFMAPPPCQCCGEEMKDSGMTEESESLNVIPKKYVIVRQVRPKYRCEVCHGDVQTAPNLPRITPGSSYSDEMIIDVALSKYCDLVPVERYVQMAARQGIIGLPPHSLIELTHQLAKFVTPVYDKLRLEIQSLLVLYADETPHRMLEGDKKSNWYLWGFFGMKSCYFECHDNRAGDVALGILRDSSCKVLLTDVYSGYLKAVKEVNKWREEHLVELIRMAFCNSHSRRKFKDIEGKFPNDVKFYLYCYKKIYKLEKDQKKTLATRRSQMKLYFKAMKLRAERDIEYFSSKSDMYGALNYFLRNYEGLTLFLNCLDVPIDNNLSERSLRGHVVGRKTWYGTHSKRGAKTLAIMFSLIESCKLSRVNPREYFDKLVKDLQSGKAAYTPQEYAQKLASPQE